jgi:hypothetical protein
MTVGRNSFDFRLCVRLQLEEYEVGVRWPPACEDVSPEDVAKQRSEDRDSEHWCVR